MMGILLLLFCLQLEYKLVKYTNLKCWKLILYLVNGNFDALTKQIRFSISIDYSQDIALGLFDTVFALMLLNKKL